jgi:hypothetical protein
MLVALGLRPEQNFKLVTFQLQYRFLRVTILMDGFGYIPCTGRKFLVGHHFETGDSSRVR